MTDTARAAWRKYSAMVQAAQACAAPLPLPADAASGPRVPAGLEGAAAPQEQGQEQALFDTVGAVTLASDGPLPPPSPSPLGVSQ